MKTYKETVEMCRKFIIDNKISVVQIAYEAGCSVQTVYNFLRGISGNNVIVDYIIENYSDKLEV